MRYVDDVIPFPLSALAVMPSILSLAEIKQRIDVPRLIDEIAGGFAAYSAGRVTVPPVGYLGFAGPPGDVHIKYGYAEGDDSFVVKIATGFPENSRLGVPTGTGLMLRFSRLTGELTAILLDEGYLTDLRTAAAGAVAARLLAPRRVTRIGILGTGVQARLQLRLLRSVTDCTDVVAYGRSPERLATYAAEMRALGYAVETTAEPDEVAARCNLIVCATASRAALLRADAVRAGSHVTALGADAPGKQELEPALFAKADIVVADSIAQCVDHGDLSYAVRDGLLSVDRVTELGRIVSGAAPGRTGDDQLTVCDLTGVAVQDIVIAGHVAHTGTRFPT